MKAARALLLQQSVKRYLTFLPLFALAGAAHAQVGAIATVDMKFTGLKLGGTGKVTVDGKEMNVNVGKLGFNLTEKGKTTSVMTVCASLTSILDNGMHEYKIYMTPNDNSGASRAGKIVSTFFDAANTKEKAMGLQLAVWEALTDNGATFSNGGRFKASSSFGSVTQTGSAMYWADQFYSAKSGTAAWLKTPDNCGGQSQMTPVPEPASLAALAVGGAALLRRRRRNRR